MRKTVRAECEACDGTGLYQGFAEAIDTAVVCLRCGGLGVASISYKEFTERKRKRVPGLKYVRRSRGGFIATGVGATGDRITVDEFYAGKKIQ